MRRVRISSCRSRSLMALLDFWVSAAMASGHGKRVEDLLYQVSEVMFSASARTHAKTRWRSTSSATLFTSWGVDEVAAVQEGHGRGAER